MKTNLKIFLFLLLILYFNYSCVDETVNHETKIYDFGYVTPNLNVDLTAIPSENMDSIACILKWRKTSAADYSVVFYEVLISTTSDFETNVYKITPENLGTDTIVQLTNKELNVIAEYLGIKQNETGTLKWKVRASNGYSENIKDDTRDVTIKRPEGFAYYPEKVYLLGTATGVGDTLKNAIQLKNDGDGMYEIFTYLGNGDIYFIEKLTNRTRYFSSLDDKLIEENKKISIVDPGKIHRILLDFNNQTIKIAAITKVSLWYSGTNSIIGNDFNLEDAKSPIWNMNMTLNLVNGSNGLLDYRYKFRMEEKDLTQKLDTIYWGSEKISSAQQTSSSAASYFYIYERDASQSDYCFKFSRDGQNGSSLKFLLDLRPDIANYTHSVTVND